MSVREVVAPEGYLIDDDNWQTAELHQGELLKPFVFTDTKYPEVWVRKIDRESKLRLAGGGIGFCVEVQSPSFFIFKTVLKSVRTKVYIILSTVLCSAVRGPQGAG